VQKFSADIVLQVLKQCRTYFYSEVAFFVLQKTSLIPGGNDSLVYTTLSGTVGMLVPFTSREDHDFFQHLEMHMRAENPPMAGRDHLAFRSYYFPVNSLMILFQFSFSREVMICFNFANIQCA